MLSSRQRNTKSKKKIGESKIINNFHHVIFVTKSGEVYYKFDLGDTGLNTYLKNFIISLLPDKNKPSGIINILYEQNFYFTNDNKTFYIFKANATAEDYNKNQYLIIIMGIDDDLDRKYLLLKVDNKNERTSINIVLKLLLFYCFGISGIS
jgi:hypothetical protein